MVKLDLVVRGDDGSYGRASRHVGVDKVGAGTQASHGAGGAVVGEGGFFRRVEGAQPVSFFCGWVSDFGCVSSPWPSSNAEEPSR